MAAHGKGWRKIIRWLAISVVTVVVVLTLAVTIANYRSGLRVKRVREDLARQGVPVHIADLQKGDIPEAENSYKDLERLREELLKAETAVCGTEERYAAFLSRAPLAADKVRELEAILASYQALLENLKSASAKKYFDIPLRSGDTRHGVEPLDNTRVVVDKCLKELQLVRSVARLLTADVNLKIAQGGRDDALQSAIAILNWSILAEQQPLLVSHLVAVAIQGMGMEGASRVLYAGDVSDKGLEDLLAVLTKFDVNRRWKNSLHGELAFFGDVFQPTLPAAFRFLWFQRDAEATYLESMQQAAVTGVITDGGRITSLPEVPQSWMWNLTGPAVQSAHLSNGECEARRRALWILTQWRKGEAKAQTLAELQIASTMANDPFADGEMKYIASPQGPIIYSVGKNRVDDKGELSRNSDVGVGPWNGTEE